LHLLFFRLFVVCGAARNRLFPGWFSRSKRAGVVREGDSFTSRRRLKRRVSSFSEPPARAAAGVGAARLPAAVRGSRGKPGQAVPSSGGFRGPRGGIKSRGSLGSKPSPRTRPRRDYLLIPSDSGVGFARPFRGNKTKIKQIRGEKCEGERKPLSLERQGASPSPSGRFSLLLIPKVQTLRSVPFSRAS